LKSNKIGLGIFIIIVGVLWTLMSLGIIDWSIFEALFKLWPLILVVIGLNIIFKDNSIAKVVVWLLFLGTLVFYNNFISNNYQPGNNGATEHVIFEKKGETSNAELKLAVGGIKLDVGSTGANLMEADITKGDIKNSIQYGNGNENAEINLERKSFLDWNTRSMNDDCRVYLNKDVVWDMKAEVGAVKGTMDMSDLKVRKLDMNVGAGKLKLIMGKLQDTSDIKINGGASTFDMVIPKDAGIKIKMDGALNKTNFDELGLEKRDAYYYSHNYNQAEVKFDIDVNMGVGKLTIELQ